MSVNRGYAIKCFNECRLLVLMFGLGLGLGLIDNVKGYDDEVKNSNFRNEINVEKTGFLSKVGRIRCFYLISSGHLSKWILKTMLALIYCAFLLF